jgi:co-chaperonin GroES (HSP10)
MQTPPYRPLGNKYLILPDQTEAESETIGNVTLSAPPPDPHKRSFEGTVVAKGKSCVELEVDDKAVYGEFSGYEREIDGIKYLVLQENEILMEHLAEEVPEGEELPEIPLPAPVVSTPGICCLCNEAAGTPTGVVCNDCLLF